MAEIMTGKYQFLQDLKFENMLHARIVRPPHYHCELEKLDPDVISRLEKENVFVIRDGSFLAVATKQEYKAVKAARRIALLPNGRLKNNYQKKIYTLN